MLICSGFQLAGDTKNMMSEHRCVSQASKLLLFSSNCYGNKVSIRDFTWNTHQFFTFGCLNCVTTWILHQLLKSEFHWDFTYSSEIRGVTSLTVPGGQAGIRREVQPKRRKRPKMEEKTLTFCTFVKGWKTENGVIPKKRRQITSLVRDPLSSFFLKFWLFFLFFTKVLSFLSSFWPFGWARLSPGKALATPLSEIL